VGGVALGLETADDVARAATAMLARVKAKRPDARIEGFAVEPMIRRAGAVELILGMTEDTLFGPVILFGHGGVAVEVIDDKALALPPLNLALARALMAGTRVRRLMEGVRGAPPAAIDQVAMALVRVSQLVIDFGEVAELDVNPLLADATGIVALDARIRVARARRTGEDRLAIRPYPRALEGRAQLKDGREVTLRPVKPEDGPALQAAFKRLSARSVRFRFFHRLKSLSDAWAARLTQIDYDREMAILALDPAEADDGVLGVVRMIADPDNERAEYAIVVRDDVARRGLGEFLMRRIIDHARARGTGELVGDVMGENAPMLALAAKLGFSRAPSPDDPAIVRTRLILRR
jgi:acetyltransferase